MDNRPLSDRYAESAKDWVDKDSAASLLEETKSATLAQKMGALMGANPKMAVNRAEMQVKASDEWHEYVETMVAARKAANLAKVKLEWLRMKFNEWQSEAADERVKAKL